MRKIIVSVGLIAAGTAGLEAAAYDPGLSPMEATKLWSLSGTLRGFYDDNYSTSPSGVKQGSFGAEISPSISLNMPLQQTELGLKYVYGLYYYEQREHLGQRPIDQTHQFDLWVDHAFSARWQAKALDSFVVAQEPELLTASGAATSVPTRVEGNNIVNNAVLTLNTEWTQLLSTTLGYNNTFSDYQNSGGTASAPSLAGLLNRVDQSVSLDFNWRLQEETTAFVGFEFEQVNYIGNEPIATGNVSDNRDNRSEIVYIGAQHAFTENLSASAKVGGQYTEYYNDPKGNTSQLAPWVDISGTYTYIPGSYVQLGFTQSRNATDVINQDSSGRITQDQESSVIYASLNHQLTPKLMGSIVGDWQNSVFNGGALDGQSETYYDLGLNLSYNFNDHFSAEVGYNYDDVTSPAGQGYTRNRGYVGVTATY